MSSTKDYLQFVQGLIPSNWFTPVTCPACSAFRTWNALGKAAKLKYAIESQCLHPPHRKAVGLTVAAILPSCLLSFFSLAPRSPFLQDGGHIGIWRARKMGGQVFLSLKAISLPKFTQNHQAPAKFIKVILWFLVYHCLTPHRENSLDAVSPLKILVLEAWSPGWGHWGCARPKRQACWKAPGQRAPCEGITADLGKWERSHRSGLALVRAGCYKRESLALPLFCFVGILFVCFKGVVYFLFVVFASCLPYDTHGVLPPCDIIITSDTTRRPSPKSKLMGLPNWTFSL